MKITITAREALDRGCWGAIARLKGYNEYAVNEGMDPSTEIELTIDEARELGLLDEEE
jgi:hypothetical protein